MSRRPETSKPTSTPQQTSSKVAALCRFSWRISLALLLILGGLASEAQVTSPKRAIERDGKALVEHLGAEFDAGDVPVSGVVGFGGPRPARE